MPSYFVSTSGSDANVGSFESPFETIQYAITQASIGDTIQILSNLSVISPITINKELSIIGRATSSSGSRPVINIATAANATAVLCNKTNITLQGLEFVHNPATVGFNDTCISLAHGGTYVVPDSGIMVNQNINILDCKIFFTKFGVSSTAKYFSVQHCELVSKAITTARSIAIYSQDGTVDILNNVFTTSVGNNKIELLHNNFGPTNDGYQNKRNGTVNFIGNSTSGINITGVRPIFFEAGADAGLDGDSYSFNISYNSIRTTNDCMMLLQPSNANFLNFIGLITVNNNTFDNNPSEATSKNGLVRVSADWGGGLGPLRTTPLTTPIDNPKFLIYLNDRSNIAAQYSANAYDVDGKNVLIFTGFLAYGEGEGLYYTGGLSTSTINPILTTTAPAKLTQTITFGALSSQSYSLNGLISLTGTASSGLPVSYSSDNTSVTDISGTSLVIKGVGTATITASQVGNGSYDAAIEVSQNQVITKANQTITFDDNSYTFTDSTYTLNATTNSGLPVTYTSSNNEIASIVDGNKLVFTQNGQVSVTVDQSGNDNYNPALSVVRLFVRNVMDVTNYTGGQINVTAAANNLITNAQGTLSITVLNHIFTKNLGVAYLVNSGFTGAVSMVNISALDGSGNPITNLSTDNLLINLSLPQSNPTSTLQMYKLDASANIMMDPQPTGYPVTLQYQSGYHWTALLPTLSSYVIKDMNAPSGDIGGDPHLKTVHGKEVLLPNDWLYVKLYQKDGIQVNAKCGFLNSEDLQNLHRCIKNKNKSIVKVDPKKNTWVVDFTYFIELDILEKDELVFKYDLIHDKELINKNITVEKNKSSKGLYSIVQKSTYPPKHLSSYFIHLNNNNMLTIDIDNFWDDLNNIGLLLFDRTTEGYSGEFFNHSIENKLH